MGGADHGDEWCVSPLSTNDQSAVETERWGRLLLARRVSRPTEGFRSQQPAAPIRRALRPESSPYTKAVLDRSAIGDR